jgi:methyltransferase (TIGR00027 family)
VSNVSDTARWAARYRAVESARADALFRDPLADRLAGEKGEEIAARAPRQVRNGWPVVARTVAIDGMIRLALSEGCDCVINLASGLDTRPYRLSLAPKLRWVEADLPGIVDEKAALLAGERPRCELVHFKVDLSDAAARRACLDAALAGCSKALVLTEGLLMYLDEPTVKALAHDLDRPEVAWWVLETLSPGVRDLVMKTMRNELGNAPFNFAPAEGIAFFERLGWKVRELRSMVREAQRLRRLPFPLNLIMLLPIPDPDPRNLGNDRWSGVALLQRA